MHTQYIINCKYYSYIDLSTLATDKSVTNKDILLAQKKGKLACGYIFGASVGIT